MRKAIGLPQLLRKKVNKRNAIECNGK